MEKPIAFEILKKVERKIKGVPYTYLDMYSNCREQGFCICGVSGRVVFSRDRNTDNIVVYHGGTTQFSMHGNVPDEFVYREQRAYFEYIDDAVEYIVGLVKFASHF